MYRSKCPCNNCRIVDSGHLYVQNYFRVPYQDFVAKSNHLNHFNTNTRSNFKFMRTTSTIKTKRDGPRIYFKQFVFVTKILIESYHNVLELKGRQTEVCLLEGRHSHSNVPISDATKQYHKAMKYCLFKLTRSKMWACNQIALLPQKTGSPHSSN